MRFRSYFLTPALVLPMLLAGCAEPRAEAREADVQMIAAATEAIEALESAEDGVMQVYKSPTCGCCGAWVDHAEEAGFTTEVTDVPNVTPVKSRLGMPLDLASCHTTVVDGYVLEGHVPADVVQRLLEERPDIAGLAVPGMPMGSPGMEGPYTDPYDIIAFREDGSRYVYESR